jgi:DNA replication protein DnaC
MFGNSFSISNPETFEVYKKVYERLLIGLKRKKSKGVFITGSIGVGKTAMMKIIQRAFKDTERRFKWVSGYELRDLSEQMPIMEIKGIYGANLKCDLYIDDIGLSIDVKRYGNTVNIISEIMMERYELYVYNGYKTHLSSNIVAAVKDNSKNIPTIEKIYGARVLDRIKEMCDLIIWNGESLRK